MEYFGGTITSSNGTVANVVWNIGATSGSITASYYCQDGSDGGTTKYVNIRPQLRVPSISGFAGICRGSTTPTTYSIAAVAGAVSYTWTGSPGLTFNGSSTLTTTSLSVSVRATTAASAGTNSISVTPNGGYGFNATTTRNITVETSPIPASSIRIYKQGFSTTDTYMC